MRIYSKQKVFCNSCGVEMFIELSDVIGREWRVCSVDCLKEMKWRHYLSGMGKKYKPRMVEEVKLK
jgi:hypothetical protein